MTSNDESGPRGREAEEFVAAELARAGFVIEGRNVRLGYLELDIVAREGRVIAIVEVRSRSVGSFTTPFSSVGYEKRLRVRRAGERLWNRRYKNDPTVDRMRFDLASVTLGARGLELEYVRAAF